MRNRKIWMITCGIFFTSAMLAGCKMVREVDMGKVNIATPTPTKEVQRPANPTVTESPMQTPKVTMEPTKNPVTIKVANGNILDEEELFRYFYGEEKETVVAQGYVEEGWYEENYLGFQCDKGGILLNYVKGYNLYAGSARNQFSMKDMRNGGAGRSYEPLCDMGYRYSQKFLEKYPEIDLESCSREEAIAACAPLAQICGYGDAQVKVYAVTEEFLKEETEYWADIGYRYSAPKPDYEYVSPRDIELALEAGDELLANKLKYKKTYKQCSTKKWTKEHEAYILIYNSMLNNQVLSDSYYDMYCIYVPLYDSIVYANVNQPLIAVEGMEETSLMTEDEALAKTIRFLGVEESLKDVTITGVTMIYDAEYEKINPDLPEEEWTIDPCWRVDYVLSEKLLEQPIYQTDKYNGTVIFNAIDGRRM